MLTARSTDDDKLLGLDIGADDYLTKPFNPRELVARIRAVLRRATPDEEPVEDVRFGDLTVSFVRHEVFLQGRPVSLTPTEFRLLETLVKNPGRAFSRADLLDRAFGYDYDGVERTVDVHIMNLRRKIEPEPGRPRLCYHSAGCGLPIRGPPCGVVCASAPDRHHPGGDHSRWRHRLRGHPPHHGRVPALCSAARPFRRQTPRLLPGPDLRQNQELGRYAVRGRATGPDERPAGHRCRCESHDCC